VTEICRTSGVGTQLLPPATAWVMFRAPRFDDWGVLSAGPGWPAWTSFRFLVRALAVVVQASKRGVCCLWLVGPRICGRVGGTCDIPVEALFPQGRERFELGSTGWSRVLGIDAVGGAPHCDFADEGRGVSSCCSPGWRAVTLRRVILDLVGKVGDQLGSLCQVGTPDRMGMEHFWNAREPRQRTWVDRCRLWQAPVEDSSHIACGLEVASAGRCQHVA
jgi:hypothetical protein